MNHTGSTFEVRWKVKNNGNGPTIRPTWTDAVVFNSTTTKSTLVYHPSSQSLFPGDEYEAVVNVTIPKYISGKYNIYVTANVYKQEFEYQSYQNNIGRSVSVVYYYQTHFVSVPRKSCISTNFSENLY